MPKNILLLTATINPLSGIPSLARADPLLRLGDYSRSLAFYLTQLGKCLDGIVFVENSAYDISSLAKQAQAAARRPGGIHFIFSAWIILLRMAAAMASSNWSTLRMPIQRCFARKTIKLPGSVRDVT
jgi:hypothetical protein